MKSLIALVASVIICAPAFAENPEVSVNVGDVAPEFEAKDDSGNLWKSTDHVGKEVIVVYFYPADMTGGCTKQACGFRDDYKDLKQAGVTVVGVSGDSVRNHGLFKKVYSLNFPLLADEDGQVARAFGVPLRDGGGEISRTIDGVEEKLVRGVTASRWTFIIGLDGRIIHKNTKVDAAEDSKSVLKKVQQLTAQIN
jgi:peroxiredoxin Q/BCP